MKFQRIQTVRCLDNDNDGVIYLMERGLDAILLLVDQQGEFSIRFGVNSQGWTALLSGFAHLP